MLNKNFSVYLLLLILYTLNQLIYFLRNILWDYASNPLWTNIWNWYIPWNDLVILGFQFFISGNPFFIISIQFFEVCDINFIFWYSFYNTKIPCFITIIVNPYCCNMISNTTFFGNICNFLCWRLWKEKKKIILQ